MNGPLKNEKSQQILPKSRNLAQPTKWVSESQIVSVGHIFAFLSSHHIFLSRVKMPVSVSR